MTRPPLYPLILAALLAGASRAPAIAFVSSESYLVSTGQVVSGEAWVMATRIEIDGTQEADVFTLGGSNVLTGVVRKDFWALAETVKLRGTVTENARLAGRNVAVEGRVGGNLLAAAETVQLGDGCEVGGDTALLGSRVVASGHLKGSVRIIAKQATLGGHVEGNVDIRADDIVVLKGTRIDGDIKYASPSELFLDNTVQLGGALVKTESPEPQRRPVTEALLMQAIFLAGSLLLAAPFLALFPKVAGRALYGLRIASWRCSLIGLAALFLIPVFCAFSAITLFGLPLAIVLACGYIMLVYLSKIIVALAIGQMVLRRPGPLSFGQTLITLVVGLLLVYALTSIPGIGLTVWLVVTVWGMGALLLGLLSLGRSASLPPPEGSSGREPDRTDNRPPTQGSTV
jgi:cytoskeletal protein CcmA (bactofilin family)